MKILKDATILVTGGTGSFGQRVATGLLKYQPKEIRIFSRDEKKQWEMKSRFPKLKYLIGDTRDSASVDRAMAGVDYVFHAAALKHVPSCEEFPLEAVKTNILGSQNVCTSAKEQRVKMVIGLSTDKAVKPVNAMGMSKALMEKILCNQNMDSSETRFCCVRYGNVLKTRGSVVPLFLRQIKEDLPLTITVPEMTRFLMTLDESIDLVLKALEEAQGGEIFVRKAPACTVQDLADTLRLAYSPRGSAHPIEVLGPRPGEKLEEVLVSEYEMQRIREEKQFFVIHPEYRIPRDLTKKDAGMEYTSGNTTRLDRIEDINAILKRVEKTETIE